MTWFFAVVLVLILGAVAVVAVGHGEGLPPADPAAELRLPTDRAIGADDLRSLRLNTSLPGYRMSEVDELLRRLTTQLEAGSTVEHSGDRPLSYGRPDQDLSER